MTLSIIIPAYNELASVMKCLKSLQDNQYSPSGQHQYIVQDDASPEYNALEVIPHRIATALRNPVNLGFAGNCNQGAASCTNDILFFVNQDVFATEIISTGWDAALLDAFEDDNVGIVGPRLLFPDGSIQSAGGLFDGKRQPVHRCLGYSNPNHWEVNEPRSVSWVTGAALAIRRELFEQLGGFDTSYVGGYFEDADLCIRARLLGYSIWYEPHCTLYHSVGSTGGNPNFRQNALLFRDRWAAHIEPDIAVVKEGFW